jgi:hypothetical protein
MRRHQRLDKKRLTWVPTLERDEQARIGKVVCDEHLGGLLRHYWHAA